MSIVLSIIPLHELEGDAIGLMQGRALLARAPTVISDPSKTDVDPPDQENRPSRKVCGFRVHLGVALNELFGFHGHGKGRFCTISDFLAIGMAINKIVGLCSLLNKIVRSFPGQNDVIGHSGRKRTLFGKHSSVLYRVRHVCWVD